MAQATQSSIPDPLRVPHESHGAWLMRRLWDRMNKRNEHTIGCIVGREGSGKSHTALKIGNSVDPSFNADRVYFDVAEFLDVLRSGEFSTGEVYVLDEAGVSMGRRTWQERSQILANQALQLIRDHNIGLIFTLPRLSELDSQAKGRLQWFYEVRDKEPDQYVRGKWKFLDPDRADQTGEVYHHFPRRRRDNQVKRIKSVAFTPPDQSIVGPYEEHKTEFQHEIYDETISRLRDEDDSEEDEGRGVEDIADEVRSERLDEFLDEHGGNGMKYIDRDLIRVEYDLSHTDASAVAKLVKREVDEL